MRYISRTVSRTGEDLSGGKWRLRAQRSGRRRRKEPRRRPLRRRQEDRKRRGVRYAAERSGRKVERTETEKAGRQGRRKQYGDPERRHQKRSQRAGPIKKEERGARMNTAEGRREARNKQGQGSGQQVGGKERQGRKGGENGEVHEQRQRIPNPRHQGKSDEQARKRKTQEATCRERGRQEGKAGKNARGRVGGGREDDARSPEKRQQGTARAGQSRGEQQRRTGRSYGAQTTEGERSSGDRGTGQRGALKYVGTIEKRKRQGVWGRSTDQHNTLKHGEDRGGGERINARGRISKDRDASLSQ